MHTGERMEGRLVKVNGNDLSVAISPAPTSSLTIFFLHGSMATMNQFEVLFPAFQGRANLVAYDSVGCGSSEKPHVTSKYSTESLLGDAVTIFEEHATAHNILVGHSYGTCQVARLCQHLQAKAKNEISYGNSAMIKEIRGAILLGSTLSMPSGGHPIFSLPVCILSLLQGYLSSSFIEMAHSPDCDPEVKKRAYEVSSRNDMAVVRDFYTQFEWAKEDDWKSLATIPTLICQGKDDKITPLDGALKLQEFIATQTRLQDQTQLSGSSEGTNVLQTGSAGTKQKKYYDGGKGEGEGVVLTIIEKAGHQLMLERPSEVVKAIEDFIVTDCGFATFRR